MKWYQRFQSKKKRLIRMHAVDQAIYSFMCDPSTRELERALVIPKSTIHDSIKRLRNAGLGSGRWSL